MHAYLITAHKCSLLTGTFRSPAGCMSALEAERFLEAEGEVDEQPTAAAANGDGAAVAAEAKLQPVLA